MRINRYQQEKLASQMVGTPGVDQTGNILADSTLRGANSIAESALYAQRQDAQRGAQMNAAILGLAQDVGQGIANDVSAHQTLTRQLKAMQTDAFAKNIAYELSKGDKDVRSAIRKDPKYTWTSVGADEAYESGVNDVYNEIKGRYQLDKNPVLAAKVDNAWAEMRKTGMADVKEFQFNRDTDIAKAGTEKAIYDVKGELEGAANIEEVREIMTRQNGIVDNVFLTLGPKGRAQHMDAIREGLSGYIERDIRKAYEVNPEDLYKNLGNDPAVVDWMRQGTFPQLNERDVAHLEQANRNYKSAAVEKQRHFIEWQGLGTEFQIDKIVDDAVTAAIETGDPMKAADAFVQLNALRAAEEAKPIEMRNTKLTNDISSQLKFLSNLNITMYNRKMSDQEREYMRKRGAINDARGDDAYEYTQSQRQKEEARGEGAGLETRGAINKKFQDMMGLIKLGKQKMIKPSEVRDLGTTLKDAYNRDYITKDEYESRKKLINEIGEAAAPAQLKRQATVGLVEGWWSNGQSLLRGNPKLDLDIARLNGASDFLMQSFGIKKGTIEAQDLSRLVEVEFDKIIDSNYTSKGLELPRGAEVDYAKMNAEKNAYNILIQGKASAFVKKKVQHNPLADQKKEPKATVSGFKLPKGIVPPPPPTAISPNPQTTPPAPIPRAALDPSYGEET